MRLAAVPSCVCHMLASRLQQCTVVRAKSVKNVPFVPIERLDTMNNTNSIRYARWKIAIRHSMHVSESWTTWTDNSKTDIQIIVLLD
jgi:hypothetical protein